MSRHHQTRRELTLAAERAGLSREEAAEALGVRPITFSYWAAQYVAVPERHLRRLADVLGLTVAEVEAMTRPRTGVPNSIAATMEARGVDLAELAARTGISRARLQPIIGGKAWVPPGVGAALEAALGTSLELLMADPGAER